MYDTATIDIQIRNVNERPTFNAERLNQTIFVTGENPVGSNVGTPFKFITSDPEGGTVRFQIVCENPSHCKHRSRSSLPYVNFDPFDVFFILEENGQVILKSRSLKSGESK